MNNQVVLITGCSSGVGRNLCVALKKRGYTVVASARSLHKIEDLDVDMKVELDVTKGNTIKRAVDEMILRFGRIDILVNNAGYSVRVAVEEMNLHETEKMFDVNVYGVIRMIQEVAPYMRKQHYGKIVNIGSVAGKLTGMINGGYSATKHAVEAISEAARYELKQFGIQVTLLEPGAIETEFFNTLSLNSDQRMQRSESPYYAFYQRNLEEQKTQKRADVQESVERICRIIDKKKWKVRYTISLPLIYSILIKLPDGIKEKLILKFS